MIATIGARSRYASAMPVSRFVAPGPSVRHRHGGATGEPPVHVGHERGALLVAGRDVADRLGPRERLEDVQRLLAGHGEHVLAALRLEAGDEEVGGGPGRRGGGRGHAAGSVRVVALPRP